MKVLLFYFIVMQPGAPPDFQESAGYTTLAACEQAIVEEGAMDNWGPFSMCYAREIR